MDYKQTILDNNDRIDEAIDIVEDLPDFVDTSDADATANDIVKDKTAYVNGEKITGTYEGEEINNQDKTITENGTYEADQGYTGLGTVIVDVEGGALPQEEYDLCLEMIDELLGDLPYTQVEYIESTGTQYIDTGISGGSSGAWEIKVNLLNKNTDYPHIMAGPNKARSS